MMKMTKEQKYFSEWTERDDLIGVISDVSKEKTGRRLRLNFNKYSTEELKDIYEQVRGWK